VTAIAVVAGKAAPGATTVANALTLAFPEPVLLVDADPAGGDVVPGLLPGRASTDTGLLSWLVATRHLTAIEATEQLPQHALSLPEAGDAWVLAGLQGPGQSGVLASGGWSRLATSVERCGPVLGRAVIVDIGRLSDVSGWPVVDVCDLVLLVVRPTARSVQGAFAAIQLLRRRLGDLDHVRLVVCGGGPYTPDQVAAALKFERADRVDQIPADSRAAASLVDGSAATMFGLTRTRLVRAAGQLADRAVAQISTSTATTDLTSSASTGYAPSRLPGVGS
jgi:MinD-like ATPase involved in chromosome partitioning or flagellar assembly